MKRFDTFATTRMAFLPDAFDDRITNGNGHDTALP